MGVAALHARPDLAGDGAGELLVGAGLGLDVERRGPGGALLGLPLLNQRPQVDAAAVVLALGRMRQRLG